MVTKIGLTLEIERLIDGLAAFHAKQSAPSLDDLHAEFGRLVTRTLALLQNGESDLAHDLAESSDRLWTELSDPDRFAALAQES